MVSQSVKNTGFTIVELLIVIVIIGVLAGITVVAFNGIQERARNARYASAIDSYTKALTAYKGEFGEYPSTELPPGETGNGTVCLGDKYPAASGGFPEGRCLAYNSSYDYQVNTAVNEALRKVMGAHPNTSDLVYRGTNRGLWYQSVGTVTRATNISYSISGNQTCARGDKIIDGTNTRCILSFN